MSSDEAAHLGMVEQMVDERDVHSRRHDRHCDFRIGEMARHTTYKRDLCHCLRASQHMMGLARYVGPKTTLFALMQVLE
jgi:hypothetical protein